MSADPQKFDHARVASLAGQLAALEQECEELRKVATKAGQELSSAETRLRNLRSDFTRAVSRQLDATLLPQRNMGQPA